MQSNRSPPACLCTGPGDEGENEQRPPDQDSRRWQRRRAKTWTSQPKVYPRSIALTRCRQAGRPRRGQFAGRRQVGGQPARSSPPPPATPAGSRPGSCLRLPLRQRARVLSPARRSRPALSTPPLSPCVARSRSRSFRPRSCSRSAELRIRHPQCPRHARRGSRRPESRHQARRDTKRLFKGLRRVVNGADDRPHGFS